MCWKSRNFSCTYLKMPPDLSLLKYSSLASVLLQTTSTSGLGPFSISLIKKTENQRIDAFELWCWRKLLRVPWTARRSKQSILKEINPEYSLEGLMLKQKLQYFVHLMQRADSGKDPDAGENWEWQEKGATDDEMVGWHHWLNEFEQTHGDSEGHKSLACCNPSSCKELDVI